ncbi:GRF zinc finger protein [Arachis hypogaea]|nr:GRF zinc finger protein [Arachis hypogaea]
MAAESSISSRSKSSSHGRLLLCFHGERPVMRTSGTKENYGRRFWGYVYYGVHEGCNFFRWAEPETEVENPKITRMKKKVASLKSRTKAAEWKLMVVALLGFVGWARLVLLNVVW